MTIKKIIQNKIKVLQGEMAMAIENSLLEHAHALEVEIDELQQIFIRLKSSQNEVD